MNATELRKKILELREGQDRTLEDDMGHVYIVEGLEDGWRFRSEGSTIMMRLNNVIAVGTDVYLLQEDEEGEKHVFAILDAPHWFIDEEE